MGDVMEYGANEIGQGINQAAEGARAVGEFLGNQAIRLSGLEGAKAAPTEYQTGQDLVQVGIAEVGSGDLQSGIGTVAAGVQMQSDAIGDMAGVIENVSAPLFLTPAAPYVAPIYAGASYASFMADMTGVGMEIVKASTGNGSVEEAVRRTAFTLGNAIIPGRVSPRSEVGQRGVSVGIDEVDHQTSGN